MLRPSVRSRLVRVVVVALAATFAGAVGASADPVTVAFTVFADPFDPLHPAPSRGSFTYDSAFLPAGSGTWYSTGVPGTDASFHWHDTDWGAATFRISELNSDSAGRLISWFAFGTPSGTGWISGPASATVDDFYMSSYGDFSYTYPGFAGTFQGSALSAQTPAATPEPSALLLLGTGIFGLYRRRRRLHLPG